MPVRFPYTADGQIALTVLMNTTFHKYWQVLGLAFLEARNIQKRFAGVIALNDIFFSCEKGRITGLLGANGSGKSTLAKIITGVYRADKGEILYRGNAVAFNSPAESKRNGISMIFQNLSLVDDLTVWENIVLGCEKMKGLMLDDVWAQQKAKAILAELWPSLDINRYVYQLSPSEMQIVEIAKALISEPELLIMDEPTAALEREQVCSLFRYVRALAEKQTAIIFTSHRMKEVMEICDNVVVFKNGQNVGTIDFTKEERDSDRIVTMIAGESEHTSEIRKRRSIALEEKMNIENLNYLDKLHDISFTLHRGEVLGIGGLSGQGQEELLLALAGSYTNLSVERVTLFGQDIKLNNPSKAISNRIFLVPGDRNVEGLMCNHSVYSNLVYPQMAKKSARTLFSRRKWLVKCDEIIRLLGIKLSDVTVPVSTLSGGNAQKVVLGKWLTFEPEVMLLSDPAKGVDVGAKSDMYHFLRKLAEDKGTSIVLYTSDTEELIEQCDRLLIMFEGRIVKELAGDQINEKAIYQATMQGADAIATKEA